MSAMSGETIHRKPKRQLGCECSPELYNMVRERAAATGDSMAGVLRSAVVELLTSEPDVLSAMNGRGKGGSGAAALDSFAAHGPDGSGLASSDDLPAVVDAISSSMAAVMKSALVEFLMASPDPLKAMCSTSGATVGDGLWFMAEFLRFYAEWSSGSASEPEAAEGPDSAAGS